MVGAFLLFPFGRILAIILAVGSFILFGMFSRRDTLLVLITSLLYLILFPWLGLDSYFLLFAAGLLLVPSMKRLRVIYWCWTLVSMFKLIASYLLLGNWNFYGSYFDIHSMKLSQSVADSNIAGLLLLGLIFLKANIIEKPLFALTIIAVGATTGSRTFLVALALMSIYLMVRAGFLVCLSVSFIGIFYLNTFVALLPERGFDSSRFLSWQMALDDYGLIGLKNLESTEKYYVSAFHNGILDAYHFYGPLLGSLLQILFVLFLLIKLRCNLPSVLTSIYVLFVYMTSVVWRGDIMFFLVAYNVLSHDIKIFRK